MVSQCEVPKLCSALIELEVMGDLQLLRIVRVDETVAERRKAHRFVCARAAHATAARVLSCVVVVDDLVDGAAVLDTQNSKRHVSVSLSQSLSLFFLAGVPPAIQ